MSTTIEEATPIQSPVAIQQFSDLALPVEIQLAVQQSGYLQPTPVQAEIIPTMLAGRDVLAQSQTGSGKTAAFALPILSRLQQGRRLPQVLVLAPTRELAQQVAQAFETYGANLPKLRVLTIYGGADYQPQLRGLSRGVDIVVGTPGRVIDHLERGTLKLDELQCLVLDEADEMLNMGFQEDVERILSSAVQPKQMALFSATMPPAIREIADKHLNDPVLVTIRQKTLTAESIEQRCVFVPERNKMELLVRLLELENTDGVIVFTKTKDTTVRVSEHLGRLGISAAALNGDLPQARRQRTVDQLKSGQLNVLVATDVAARGLDVQRISHVFNFDLPHDGESYVHRIGRTGRAGRAGVAYIFLTPIQQRKLRLIEKVTRQPIQIVDFPTARQINVKRVERFKSDITDTIAKQDISAFQTLVTQYAQETGTDPLIIAAALACQTRSGRSMFVKDAQLKDLSASETESRPGARSRNFSDREGKQRSERFRSPRGSEDSDRPDHRSGPRRRNNSGRPAPGMQRYQLAVGRSDGVKPGNIVGAIANEAGIAGSDIGPIEIRPAYTTIDLPAGLPEHVVNLLRRTRVAGKQLKIRLYAPPRA
ncbi:MAG: DEAD/DEAH box helicase [Pirellulaceae bacterium]|nr:DEAD/DEAH box helicase [Pirellulaceae bacterium]